MADRVKTIGTGGDYADPILWAAGEGNINDGDRAVGEQLEDIAMSALFRPNQTFPNGGLLRGNKTVTGKSGDGWTLSNTAGTRVCLAPSDSIHFEDIEWDLGANTYTIQNSGNNTLTRCLMPDGFIYYIADKSLTLNNCLLAKMDGLASTTQGNITLSNTTVTDRLIIRAETLLTFLNSNSIAADWLLGRGNYTNSETLANYNYILQNAPASDFGPGSGNNTINTDTTAEMVDYAGGDYRIKSTSPLATAGQGGTFVGAFLEQSSGNTLSADSGSYSLIGENADLLKSNRIEAEAGLYIFFGSDINLLKGYALDAEQGLYDYLGQDVDLIYTPAGSFVLEAESGFYSYIGSDVNFNRDRVIIASGGSYLYDGTDIQIILPGQIWTDKPKASTNWTNQDSVTTIWTDK